MRVTRSERPKEASFDLTPMIDVVLLLIIFFSLTAQFSDTQARAMDLPREKGDARKAGAPASMVIDLDKNGLMFVAGEQCDGQRLAELLKRHSKSSTADAPSLEVLVRADRACRTSYLNALGRTLADSGIRRWKLATAGPGG